MGSRKKILWLFLAAAAALYFVRLGASSIWDANEAFYVETPREMLAAHDLINPSFNFLPRFNKPVLSYWMVAGLYKLFGVSVSIERVGIAIGAFVIIACAFVLAWLLSEGPTGGRRVSAGLWAAAGLAVSPRFVMFARRIFIDVWITAFLSLALTCFALSESDRSHRRRYLVLMYISIGLATLTKGPVAIVLPVLAAAVYLALTRDWGRIRELMIPLGILIVAAIVLPWYGALYQQHGWTHIKSFLISENLQRYTSGYGVNQRRGGLFYLPVVFSDSFPVSLFLFAAGAATWSARRRWRPEGPEAHPPGVKIELLLWCWIVAIVGFFSFSAGKQDLYVLPIVCAVAALGGAAIDRGTPESRLRGWLKGTLVAAGLLVAIAGAAVLRLFGGAGRVYALNGAMAIGVCGVAGGLVVLALTLRRRPVHGAFALIAAVLAIDWIFVVQVLPAFERYKPVVQFSREIERRSQPDATVVTYQVALPSLVYYLERHVDEYFDQDLFVRAVTSSHPAYAVLPDDDYAALAGRLRARTCVIDRGPTFDARLNHMLARQPEPQLLLISNVCP